MRDIGTALAAGLRAPVRRPRLVLLLWLARLVPVVLFFSLPVYAAAKAELGHQPQARVMLDASADTSGFAWAWQRDFFATRFDAPERLFWLILGGWFVVTLLAGGIVAELVRGREEPLLAACGRYAGRFLRLALVAAALVYVADAGINALLAARQAETARLHHTQDYGVESAVARGVLFLALFFLIGAVHSYARIDLVANDRRSALLAFGRGLGLLLLRLPKLLVVELGMALAAGLAAVLAFVLLRATRLGTDATWLSFGLFLVGAALGSYLRTGIELGTVEARCRVLLARRPLSPIETVLRAEAGTDADAGPPPGSPAI